MICIRQALRVLVGGLICASLAAGAAAQDAPKADDKQISGLVARLGDRDFRARDQAQKDLIAIGAPARPAVQAALSSGDLEIAQRAKLILVGIARSSFDAASKKAQDNMLWSCPIKSGMVGSPIVKDGVGYVVGADRTIHAVDLKTGKEKWSQAKDLPGDENAPVVQIALSGAGVVVAFTDGTLAGLDFASGKVLWKRDPDNAANANANIGINAPQMARIQMVRVGLGGRGNSPTPSMAADGSLVFMVEGAGIVVLDAKSGDKKSTINLNNALPVSKLYIDAGRMIFLTPDSRCHCYSLADMKEIWSVAAAGGFDGVICEDGKTYLACVASVMAVDSVTGKQLWNCQIDDPRAGSYGGPRAGSSLKIIDGLLYQSDGARLIVTDLKEGKCRSVRPIEYWHDAQEDEQPDAQGNAGFGGRVVMRNLAVNGAQMAFVNGRWMPAGQVAMTSAVIEGMTAYVGAPHGLYAVGLAEGLPLWRLRGAALSGAPVAADGVLYFGTEDESAAAGAVMNPPAVGGVGGGGVAPAPAGQAATAPAADGNVNLPPGLHAMKIK
jgi:outer membrane protein assembly factor BamB